MKSDTDPSEPDFDHDALAAERDALAAQVLESTIRDLIANGLIDPTKLTEAELLREVNRIAVEDESYMDDLRVSLNHEDELLQEARRYASLDRWEFANLMYATWCEHRLNYLLTWAAFTKGFNYKQRIELISGLSIHQKTGAVWALLFDSWLDEETAANIRTVAANRNAFVHYKWRSEPSKEPRRTDASPARLAAEAGVRAVAGLDELYRSFVLRGYSGLSAL